MSETTINDLKRILLNGVYIQETYEGALESSRGGAYTWTKRYILRKKGDNVFNKTQEMEQYEAYSVLQSFILRFLQIINYPTNEYTITLWANKINVEVDKENYPVYKGTVTWETDTRKPDYLVQPTTWSHRMIGGTRTVKFPAMQQRYHTRPGIIPIPYAGVNWNGKEYEGVDVYSPEWQLIAKQQILKAGVNTDYFFWLVGMAKTVNAFPFKNLPPGTVLYVGADIDEGKNRENEVYNITHQFIVEPNMENFNFDGIHIPFKGGHEYMWTAKSRQIIIEPDPNNPSNSIQHIVPATRQVNIAPMYGESDLNLLFA